MNMSRRARDKWHPAVRVRHHDDATPAGGARFTVQEVAALYNFPEHLDGTGQTIGLIEPTGGYDPTDLEQYCKLVAAPLPMITHVGDNRPGGNGAADLEVTLDVEIAAAAAPGAQLVVYFGGGSDLYDVLETAVRDTVNNPSVLSISWGAPDAVGGYWRPGELQRYEAVLKEAAEKGITVCAASGDFGAVYPAQASTFGALPSTCYPASSPWVLGCGGTSLAAEGDRLGTERVWNRLAETIAILDPSATDPTPLMHGNGGASGGGVSTALPLPDFQDDAGVPEAVVHDLTGDVLSPPRAFAGRGVPDVAANADMETGYVMVAGGTAGTAGGTSAAAPLWAGLVARLNQGLGRRLGHLNPALYSIRRQGVQVCRAIEHGSNGAYESRPGAWWNPGTGLGSPDGDALLKALQELPAGSRRSTDR